MRMFLCLLFMLFYLMETAYGGSPSYTLSLVLLLGAVLACIIIKSLLCDVLVVGA